MADAVGPVATIAANAIATSTIPREEHVVRFGSRVGLRSLCDGDLDAAIVSGHSGNLRPM